MDPTARAYANLAKLQQVRGNPAEAEAAFKKAVEADPKSVGARLALGQFYWAAGRYNDAERLYKEAVTVDPKDILANRAFANLLIITNRAADAEPYLKAVVDLSADAGPRLGLADFYARTDRPDEAMKLLNAVAADQTPEASLAKVRLAAIEYSRNRRAEAAGARKVLEKESHTNPDSQS